jgi:Tfp pilus assembly protein PilN
MRAVNLLPADARASTSPLGSFGSGLKARKTLQIGGIVTVVLAALFVGLFLHERSVVHSKRSELATDQARLVAVQAQVNAVRAAQQAAAARFNAVETVVDSRMNWDRTMRDLAHVLPTDVVLSSLQASAPVTAAAAGAASAAATDAPAAPATTLSALTVAGSAPSYVRVGVVLDRLALLPWLSNVTLQSTAKTPGAPATFSLTAGVSEVH